MYQIMWLNTDIIILSTQGVSTYSSVEENDGASSCDGREYVHSNSEEGKDHRNCVIECLEWFDLVCVNIRQDTCD